uniref:Uncharacterized protein n=1 Tax=Magallana gigas TaxID=29159 RepID=K1QTW8_MAGGI
MLQTSRIWTVVASGLKTLGESDVAGAGRRIPDCALTIAHVANMTVTAEICKGPVTSSCVHTACSRCKINGIAVGSQGK